jgi:plasmid stabilization system protein ParE
MIVYHPAARREYDRQVVHLMKTPFTTRVVANFIEEIESAEKDILRNPDRFPMVSGQIQYRRFGPTRIYRFSVIYQTDGSDLYILAIAHPARRPRYWIKRRIS